MKLRRMQGAEDRHGRRQAGGAGHRHQGEPGYLAERSGVCPVSGREAAADGGD